MNKKWIGTLILLAVTAMLTAINVMHHVRLAVVVTVVIFGIVCAVVNQAS